VEVSEGHWKHRPEHQVLIYAQINTRDVHTLIIYPRTVIAAARQESGYSPENRKIVA